MILSHKRGWNSGLLIAVAVSVLLHGGLFGLVLNRWATTLKGGDGILLDAIEIEVVDADALESAAKVREIGGSQSTMATVIGSGQTTAFSAAATSAASQSANAQPAGLAAQVDDASESTAGERADVPRVASAAAPSVAIEAAATTGSAAVTDAAAPGAAATTVVVRSEMSASAGAAPGVADRYRLDVRKALSRNPPRPSLPAGTAVAGTAVIAFSVSEIGTVQDAVLQEASRSARLNQVLLAWITGASMPVPPRGLSADQRRFSIPYTVR